MPKDNVLPIHPKVSGDPPLPEPKPKRQRERIELIETSPKPHWFVRTKERGRTLWYLRLEVTGMLPRRVGPFRTRHAALLFLDNGLNVLGTWDSWLRNEGYEKVMHRRFHRRMDACIVEDALGSQYLQRSGCRSKHVGKADALKHYTESKRSG